MDIVILNRDIDESMQLLKTISKLFKECRIVFITNNETEFREFKEINPFDLIIFDYSFLETCPEILDYKIPKMCLMDKFKQSKRYTAISRKSERGLIDNLAKIIEKNSLINSKTRELIREELTGMGYNFSLVGTQYLEEAINLMCMKNCSFNLHQEVYIPLAKKYKKTIHTIKINILNSTNFMVENFGYENVYKYLDIDASYGIGTKAIICGIINRVKKRQE